MILPFVITHPCLFCWKHQNKKYKLKKNQNCGEVQIEPHDIVEYFHSTVMTSSGMRTWPFFIKIIYYSEVFGNITIFWTPLIFVSDLAIQITITKQDDFDFCRILSATFHQPDHHQTLLSQPRSYINFCVIQ